MDHIIALKTMFQSALTWSQIERNLKKKLKCVIFQSALLQWCFKILGQISTIFFLRTVL